MNGKRIMTGLIIVMGIVCIGIGIVYKNNNKEKSFKATVMEVNDNYMLVSPFSSEDIFSSTDSVLITKKAGYNKGDIIIVYYKGSVSETYPSTIDVVKIELVSNNDYLENNEVLDNTSSDIKEDSIIDINSNTYNNNIEDDYGDNITYSESDIISYFDSELIEVSSYGTSSSYKEKAKALFIEVVDFLFYDKEIKGYTFKDLSNSAKLNILNIAFNIDDKIDGIFPGYKDELSEKYQDSKNMIVAKYLEITTNICSNNEDYCDTAKDAWRIIKDKASISWDVIKRYVSSGVENLKDWYQIYSGK